MNIVPLDLPILARVSNARSLDKAKCAMNGLLVEPAGEGRVCVVATDGFSLAWATIGLMNPSDMLPSPVVIPGQIVDAISKVKTSRRAFQSSLEIDLDRLHQLPERRQDYARSAGALACLTDGCVSRGLDHQPVAPNARR